MINIPGIVRVGKHQRWITVPEDRTFRAKGITMEQGTQLVRIPEGSVIENFHLKGGAPYTSDWAVLRGAVLKLGMQRPPIEIVSKNVFVIPSGFTLMDRPSLEYTMQQNKRADLPFTTFIRFSSEPLYLLQASFCHPDQLFMAQGIFMNSWFISPDEPAETEDNVLNGGASLLLDEVSLKKPSPGEKPINILEGLPLRPDRIIVDLKEGGRLILTD